MTGPDLLAEPAQLKLALSKQGMKLLINEVQLQRRHLQLVKEQNTALILCDRKRFAVLHENYLVLVEELEVQNKLRIGFFGKGKFEDFVGDWPETDRRNAVRVVEELKKIVPQIRRVNAQNRVLVNNQVKYIDFVMTILINTFRKGSTYGPRGASTTNRGNLFFNSAV